MFFFRTGWASRSSTTLFVLLWSSGAIFTSWGLAYASPLAFLVMRFALALLIMLGVGMRRRRWLPASGTRLRVGASGTLMVGGYSINYFMALAHGVNPGVIGVVLGVQPVLTLLLLERRFSYRRALGLVAALAGLVLVLPGSFDPTHLLGAGTGFALGALLCITFGAILQRGIRQAPADVLPLQYGIALLMCVVCAMFQPFTFEWNWNFIWPLLWLAIVISVVAQLLLYKLIRHGNLVNVTSLFYLVPVVTALMDYVFLGHRLTGSALAGTAVILVALISVLAKPKPAAD
ncbi:DMT family transporter [Paraburkholderia caballeronis]|uniref:DMT family transporter n=1 Tax=Paraburkholderia caballeronis TaxID=416943 RepID=UPI00106654CD|nr:DMT family transporter [Paraburkholderia caballeronis]TDV09455.1 threonine/homoserine efflux transporter RhtA [Paraburkholderia caballeronis]TDV13726.1 threonine/homoserine efflux transporter RhtA [Paraburkholderia caballeronis]TDV22908.1 threonine/homoserine efflux transporter RhtA [Paraburkholderia caballeronis]